MTKKELKKIIKEVYDSSKMEDIGRMGNSNLYYLGGGAYTGKEGWKGFLEEFKKATKVKYG